MSRASGVPLDRSEFALPFKPLAALSAEAAPGDDVFFFVAMLLFPHAACDKMTGGCLASLQETGKGEGAIHRPDSSPSFAKTCCALQREAIAGLD